MEIVREIFKDRPGGRDMRDLGVREMVREIGRDTVRESTAGRGQRE